MILGLGRDAVQIDPAQALAALLSLLPFLSNPLHIGGQVNPGHDPVHPSLGEDDGEDYLTHVSAEEIEGDGLGTPRVSAGPSIALLFPVVSMAVLVGLGPHGPATEAGYPIVRAIGEYSSYLWRFRFLPRSDVPSNNRPRLAESHLICARLTASPCRLSILPRHGTR